MPRRIIMVVEIYVQRIVNNLQFWIEAFAIDFHVGSLTICLIF